MRVAYLLSQFPQLSETYTATELRALGDEFETRVISLRVADALAEAPVPYVVEGKEERILGLLREFGPDVIHTHWIGPQLGLACRMARALDRPLTVRAHSFDVLWKHRDRRSRWRRWLEGPTPDRSGPIGHNLEFLRSEACLGILTFPFSIERLAAAGIPERKLIPCRAVVDVARFHDEGPNGDAVLNVGACLPKKNFDAYLELARRVPEKTFNLYPIGYETERIREKNRAMGSPVTLHEPLPHDDMPVVYKQHEWLVYTASPEIGTVGWPICVAEAQAAGVGVCFPNLRPDCREMLGPAGFLYDSLDEVEEILRAPYPEDMRRAGFEHARLSDIHAHLHLLTDLWRGAAA